MSVGDVGTGYHFGIAGGVQDPEVHKVLLVKVAEDLVVPVEGVSLRVFFAAAG